MTRSVRRFFPIIVAIALACAASTAHASVEDEVRAAFDRFVRIQNAHDAKSLEPLLADSPQFLWITRGAAVWGRDAALQRFSKLTRAPGGSTQTPRPCGWCSFLTASRSCTQWLALLQRLRRTPCWITLMGI